MATRDDTADELEEQGWPAVAEDVREGMSKEIIMSRLIDIGEGYSDAAEIVVEMDDDD